MASCTRLIRGLLALALLAAGCSLTAAAQSDTGGLTVVASGLPYPRGMTWDGSGTMHVALAGDVAEGGDQSGGTSPVEKAFGTFFAGFGGAVVKVENRCAVAVATGLPSEYQKDGWHQGVSDLAFLDGQLYAAVDGGGSARGDADHPSGIYAIDVDAHGWALIGNLDYWVPANPVKNVPGDLDPNGEPFGLLSDGKALVVSESNSGQFLRVESNGTISRVVDLSEGHPIPTGPALDKDGNLYVGDLTAAPYKDGSSKVVRWTTDGKLETVWTGLTMVTAVAVGSDGTLYALEMATGNTDQAPFIAPGTGKVVRQTGPDSAEDVVTGLDFPIGMDFGPDGALYIASPALGDTAPDGTILRADLTAQLPLAFDRGIIPTNACPPIPGVSAESGPPEAGSPVAVEAPSPPAGTPTQPPAAAAGDPSSAPAATATANAGGVAPAAGATQAVSIQNFAFNPPTLSVAAGTTVTWTNNDTTPHTSTATNGEWDSGNLNPGQSFSHTFATAGTYDYGCSYHAGMRGTITVT